MFPRRIADAATHIATSASTASAAAALFAALALAAEGGEGEDVRTALSSSAQGALHALGEIMAQSAAQSAPLLEPIGQLLIHPKGRLRTLAVTLLSSQLTHLLPQNSKAQPPVAATPHLLAIVSRLTPFFVSAASGAGDVAVSAEAVDDSTAQAALLAVDVIARALASSMPDAFERSLPQALKALHCADAGVAAAALLLVSTLIARLPQKALLEALATLVDELLRALDDFHQRHAPPAAASLEMTMVTAAFPTLIAAMPNLISPHLPRLLLAMFTHVQVFTPAESDAADADAADADTGNGVARPRTAAAHEQALRVVARAVSPRVLLQAMAEVWPQLDHSVAPALLELLTHHLAARSVAEIAARRVAAYAIIHLALRFRTDHPAAEARAASLVEDSGGKALLQLTACLNEAQLRPLFLRALSFASDGADTDEGADAETNGGGVGAYRVLSFYRMLAPSQIKFAALYAPYFALALPFATKAIVALHAADKLWPPHLFTAGAAAAAPSKTASARKRKLDAPDAAAASSAKADGTQSACAAMTAALHFVKYGLSHHRSSPAAPAEAIAALQAPLASSLLTAAAAAAATAASATNASGAQLVGAPEGVSDAAVVETAALEAVRAMAAAGGAEGVQVLHHNLCTEARAAELSTLPRNLGDERGDASVVQAARTGARRAALVGILGLHEVLGEEALTLVAEALPVASEAMEDEDSAVRQAALRLMRTLDAASNDMEE